MTTNPLRNPRRYAYAFFKALFFVAFISFSGCAQVPGAPDGSAPRNIIILYADGAAGTQWELGRYASHHLLNAPFLATDVVMRDGALGVMSTAPANALVTDSAAAATAMSSGHKTDNDMVSVLPDGKRVQTVMEAAKATGKRIGLVSTAPVYDASPAAFSVHANSRRAYQALVDQYVTLEPDVLLGGGREFFVPSTQPGGRRSDGKDVIALFRAKGYEYVRDVTELRAARGARLLGLFAAGDIDYEIDRDVARQPSIGDMAAAALKALAGRSPQGFVLFVENENTDNSAHRNDIAALIRELFAFDAAVKAALEFQREHPDTLVIVTGDHETGGLSITNALKDLKSVSESNRFYASNADLDSVWRIKLSLDKATKLIGRKPDPETLDRVIAEHFPGFVLDADLREAILQQRPLERNFSYITQAALARMISRKTAIYWGSTGHTTEPVLVGALGPGAERFRGYMDNTGFATRLKSLLGPQRETAAAPR
ncbi:MAG TPA: alkaline phosphatase [Burkholderiales bacterium]|nr:alkaline phosphatase [Burkholderiales bacterium]